MRDLIDCLAVGALFAIPLVINFLAYGLGV